MFQLSGFGISDTKPHGEKMNVWFRGTSARLPVPPPDAAAEAPAEPDAAAEAAVDAAADAAVEAAADAAVDAAADGAVDAVEVPHAVTSNPMTAMPDSHLAVLPWPADRGAEPVLGRPFAPRRMLKDFLLLVATLTLSPTLCNPSRTAAATYNAVRPGVKKRIQCGADTVSALFEISASFEEGPANRWLICWRMSVAV